jgi:hypothetical protein
VTPSRTTKSKTNGNIACRGPLRFAAIAAALPLAHAHSARVVETVSIAFRDHRAPSSHAVIRKPVGMRAAKHRIEVQDDVVTAVGPRNSPAIAAEAQGRTGHDAQAFPTREVHRNADLLEPIDNVMTRLTDKYGQSIEDGGYLVKVKGQSPLVPANSGTQYNGPRGGVRISTDKAGPDGLAMVPAKPGHTTGSVDAAGVVCAYGAAVADKDGKITVTSDKMRAVLEPSQRPVTVPRVSPEIAVPSYVCGTALTMSARLNSGDSIDKVVARANDEWEGFTRQSDREPSRRRSAGFASGRV